ncbi:MAG: ABC transporter ATP-binding protein, partial [Anaerolineae bacterium]|nr:ABC transporter ATP-binding protein [Anaerolineae bacterium]
MAIVEAHELVKTYPMGELEVQALRGISMEIEAGEFISIMGPSGSGKSTLLNILGCLDKPTRGNVVLDTQNLGEVPRKQLAAIRREKIGFVFQSYQLLSHMTALENVTLPLRYANIGRGQSQKRGKELLERVGLGDRITHRPLELSGGQQQRVAVARALVNQPSIVLADEPTGNLDSKAGSEIMELLRELNRDGQTFIIVT